MSPMSLTQIGLRMSRLTGVRAIMKDIVETLQSGAAADWINLSAGNPVLLPEVVEMWRGYTQQLAASPDFGEVVCRYGVTQGYEPLIEAVVNWFNQHYGWGITRRNILITPGSQSIYFYAANAFGGRDPAGSLRSVVLPLSPDYTGYGSVMLTEDALVSYKPKLEMLGSHRFKYRPDFDQLQIDGSTGAVLFSRPCNPTGNVLTDQEVQQILAMAEPHGIPVLIDSAYALPFPNLVFAPMQPIWAENVIHCLSLSKAGLPGERIGIAIGQEKYLKAMEAFQANASIHSSRFGQAIAAQAIASGELARLSDQVIKPHYLAKFARLEAAVDRELPADLPWYLHKAEGGLFAWLWLADLPISDWDLYQAIKTEKVVVVPGSSFFPGLEEDWPHKHQCIRISLTATMEAIEQGIAAVGRVLSKVYGRVPLSV
ncbi:MAG: valine--pyruvate transaminase [Cyanobacteriota bacterium]|nr:valine--pyruvate transaminase [Cyanobacteriota bacterium]